MFDGFSPKDSIVLTGGFDGGVGGTYLFSITSLFGCVLLFDASANCL